MEGGREGKESNFLPTRPLGASLRHAGSWGRLPLSLPPPSGAQGCCATSCTQLVPTTAHPPHSLFPGVCRAEKLASPDLAASPPILPCGSGSWAVGRSAPSPWGTQSLMSPSLLPSNAGGLTGLCLHRWLKKLAATSPPRCHRAAGLLGAPAAPPDRAAPFWPLCSPCGCSAGFASE